MSEKLKNMISKPKEVWDHTLSAIKGPPVETLMEDFTSEMTLVAEGLSDDQGRLRREQDKLSNQLSQLESENQAAVDALQSELRHTEDVLDGVADRLSGLDKQLAGLDKRLTAMEKTKPNKKANLISQLTVLVAIAAGAWVLVTVLNLFK